MDETDELAKRVPVTHSVPVLEAMELLDHIEMVALSEMFARWALTEERLEPHNRTKLIQLSSDYERIAVFAGEGWRAQRSESPQPLIVFTAIREARARQMYERR